MRIISKFRDYYDTALGHGHDPTLTYCRDTVRHKVRSTWRDKGVESLGLLFRPVSHRYSDYGKAFVIFCGRVYRYTIVYGKVCWDTDDVEASLKKNGTRAELRAFEGKRHETGQQSWRRNYATREDYERSFETTYSPVGPDLHRRFGSPVFLLSAGLPGIIILTANPILKKVRFQEVVDPYTAFQEISMYLGGVMGSPEMVHAPIPDDAMRDMKGFDEMSFKSHSPGDRKRRRRDNRARKRDKQRSKS